MGILLFRLIFGSIHPYSDSPEVLEKLRNQKVNQRLNILKNTSKAEEEMNKKIKKYFTIKFPKDS